jgi:DNA processing protein
MMKDAAYWITIAHLPRWGYLKINNLIVQFFHEKKITIVDFFNLSESNWRSDYKLDEKQILDLNQAKKELANNAFLAESFLDQGYEILPIISPEYSKTLKTNLKVANTPSILYIKGNKKILSEKSIAIVGSRAASDHALKFTDNIAKKASTEFKVVVSGFAKGVDKQALDSALKYKGQSIIVLPQGIMTFGSGFKTYYKQIIDGDVLVLSTFFPKAPWKAELAMARNPIIYGLADEIFVAESSDKGGTWSGVLDGLKKGRKIYVRKPNPGELNANDILIEKGGCPVDFNGKMIIKSYSIEEERLTTVKESEQADPLEQKILKLLKGKSLTAKELVLKLGLDWTPQKMNKYLKTLNFLELIKEKGINRFILKGSREILQKTLF